MEAAKWSGKELKKQSKRRLKTYYWRYVFMALLLLLVNSQGYLTENTNSFWGGFCSKIADSFMSVESAKEVPESGLLERLLDELNASEMLQGEIFLVCFAGVLGYTLIFAVLESLLLIFIIYPLEAGVLRCCNYNYSVKPRFKEIFYCFEHRYKNVVGVLFLREIYTVLWSLLLFVPGIVKSYEYRMIPHIIADDPGISAKDAFAMSKAMMKGQKWKTFLLDLSFIGWRVLNVVTFGLVGVLYLEPYYLLTRVGLYRKLSGIEQSMGNVYLAKGTDYSEI